MFRYALVGLIGLATSSGAIACKFAPPKDDVERRQLAEETVRNATAIIDAVVVKAYVSEGQPALLRARRVIKGPRGKRNFLVAGPTSCHIQFMQIGFRTRVVLFEGPRVYQARLYPSGPEEIDRAIAGMRRR